MNIAIVDDERESISLLSSYIGKICLQRGIEYEITAYTDGKELLEAYLPRFDVIFLDIEMKDVDGISAAEKIRRTDRNTILIFVTKMAQYAIRGYQVEALDFMVKPVEYYSFELVFRKILRYLRKNSEQTVVLNIRDSIRVLPMSQIGYVEVLDHYVTYHTVRDESLTVKGTLAEIEKKLDEKLFYRCNRCYLINISQVSAIGKNSITVNGHEIEVSRSRKKGLVQAVAAYMGGNI